MNAKSCCSRECMGNLKFQNNIEAKEKEHNIPNMRDFLIEKYIDERLSTRKISLILFGKNTSATTVKYWMDKFDIPMRHGSEAVKTQWENNPERREQAKEIAHTHLQTKESRDKLKSIMQTDEYKTKISKANKGRNNGMFGIIKENHPNWNPNLTDEERELKRATYENEQWRKSVFERDKFACQHCFDDTGGNLEAHHLYSWHAHESLRYEVNNGVTLCEQCHKDFHFSYGYKHNTQEQFIEYQLNIA